jgi:Ca-activated chloride channel family protein
MNTVDFANPWILALLWVVPLAAAGLAGLRARRMRLAEAWISRDMQAKLLPRNGNWRFVLQLTLISLGFLCAIIALARPRFGEVNQTVVRQGRDLLIVLDVSRSMLARDVMPNRLERAKADLIDLVNTLDGDRVGLVLFRHKAVQTCPLTSDYAFLLQTLDNASPDSAPPGETDIGDALRKALDALDLGESAHQAVVLVSDGEDLAENVDDAIDKAVERGIVIFTVGFGSLTGAPVPNPEGGALAYQGREVSSKMNPATLKKIASRTGGLYLPVGTARADLGDLYSRHLRNRTPREQEETVIRRHVERFSWFLLPALLFWLAACAFSQGRPLLRKAAPLALLLVMALPVFAAGKLPENERDPHRLARLAQTAARGGKFEEAADLYRKAAAADTAKNAARHLYNAGCALYQAGRYTEAAEAFRSSESVRADKPIPSSYNEGCALMRQADAGTAWQTNAAAAKTRTDAIASAAKSFQRGLEKNGMARPDDGRRNLSTAAVKADEAREHARILALQEKFGSMDASQLAGQLLERQRKIGPETTAAFSNALPAQITRLEALAAEQRESADLMGPLAAKLEDALGKQGGTNAARQIAELRQFSGALTEMLKESANRLRDADPLAQEMQPTQERAAYNLWKGIASYDQLLREDIHVQSNRMEAADRFIKQEPSLPEAGIFQRDQEEAARLTRLFAERFAQTVPEGGQPAPAVQPPAAGETGSVSNAPGITAETRKKILELAEQAVRMQTDTVKAGQEKDWPAAATLARDSHRRLKEIEDLLPKQDQKSDSQKNQQDQKQDDQQKQDKKEEQKNQQDQPQNQDQKPDKPDKPESRQEPDKDEMTEEKARELLEKASQREKEYQAEKQKRAFFDRASGDRDW